MTEIQVRNLYCFFYMYCGIVHGSDLVTTSPDYLMEKYQSFIGIPLIDDDGRDYDMELFALETKSDTYLKWYNTWIKNGKSPIPSKLMCFMVDTYDDGKSAYFKYLLESFEKYIGDFSLISDKVNPIHPVLEDSIKQMIEENILFTKEDLRDLKLRNIII